MSFFSFKLNSQTTISGKVISNKKLPLVNVNVLIKDSYDGATSDKDGNYSFVAADTGTFILHAALVGYIDFDQEIHLTGKELKIDILLFGADVQLETVEISAGMIEASDERKSTVLKPLDIVTTAGGQGDIVGALKTLPGAQQVGEGSGLFVRGGTSNETKTLIDGMIVNNPFYNGAQDVSQRGRFSPFLFKGTVFSTGGYSAQYGQALSSVLSLESVDLPEKGSSNIAISPFGISLGTNQLRAKKRFSFGADANYFNVAAYNSLVKQSIEWKRSPQFVGGSFNFRKRFTETGILKFYTYYNYSDMATLRLNVDSVNGFKDLFDLNNLNIFSILTYKEKFGNWLLNAGASYSYNKDNIKINKDTLTGQNEMAQGRLMLSRPIFRSSLFRVGTEHQYVPDQSSYNKYKRAMYENYTSAFVETDIYFFNRLVVRLGERYEYSQWLRKGAFAYRGSVALKLSKHSQLSYAQGDFYQKPDRDFLWRDHSQQFQKATHYVLNWQYVTDSITFRTELYYKKYSNLTAFTPFLNSQYYSPSYVYTPDTTNNGSGYAQGFEIFWRDKKTFKNIDYWVSYSYLDTKRQFNNYPEKVQPTFAANHTASLVFKKFFEKGIATGLTYIYASGRPYYNPNNPIFLGDRTIDYHTLGFNISYIRQIGKAFCVFVFSATNVIGNNQVFSYKYSYDGMRRQEVGLPAPRSFFLGIFMSFGIDRSKDVIDNS